MADLALTLDGDATKVENKEEKILCLQKKMKEGFALLDSGKDIPSTIDELIRSIQNDATSPKGNVEKFDELSLILVPELEYEAGDWVVPLIQAGSWLEGSIGIESDYKFGKGDTAGHLMQQPHVADYFLRYVKQSASGKTSDTVNAKLIETLTLLKALPLKIKSLPMT